MPPLGVRHAIIKCIPEHEHEQAGRKILRFVSKYGTPYIVAEHGSQSNFHLHVLWDHTLVRVVFSKFKL